MQDDETHQQFRELAAAADRLRDKMRKTARADQIPAADAQPPEIRTPPEPGPVEVAPSQQPSAEVSALAPVSVPEDVSVQNIQPNAASALDPNNSLPLTFTSLEHDEPLQEAVPGIETKRRGVPIIGSLIVLLLAAIFFGVRAYRTQPAPPAIAPVRPVIPTPEIILRLHGSNTIGAQLGPALVKAFLQDQGAQDLKVIQGKEDETAIQAVMPGDSSPKEIEIEAHGSATGFADFARNQCDIRMASRKINAKEIAQLSSLGDMTSPSSEHVIGLDGIAVIVNASNPIESLTRDQIAGIFAGAFTNWEQVSGRSGTIHVYARDSKSGTYDTFQNLVLGSRSLVATAARIEDSRELSDRVAADPNGIGFIGLPYIRSAKAVAVSDGDAKPLLTTRLTVSTEDYLLSRRLYLYTPERSANPLIPKFLTFALSQSGQEVVANNGFIPLIVQADSIVAPVDAPLRYQRLTAGADRLSLDFRFRSSSTDLDNKAIADLDRVIASLAELKLSAQNVMLIGFADGTGATDSNVTLSEERAHTVADQFAPRGLTPAVVTGFGAALPVASNATEDGRQKNRRVEIWVKK